MIYIEPNATVAPVVAFIEAAQSQLLINNYYLDDRHVLRAIADDTRRRVKVFVIVAGDPYGLDQQVAGEEAALEQAGAEVKVAPTQFEGADGYYAFDHAEYAVAPNEALVGTANWDRSAFSRNREYIYTSRDPSLIRALTSLFLADYHGTEAAPGAAPGLVVSPGSEDQIVSIIQQPGPVEIETEELGTDAAVLSALETKGPEAQVIIPKRGAKARVLRELEASGVQVRSLEGLYMHAKVIVGRKEAFLGSQNFTVTSLGYNREIGIVLSDGGDLRTLNAVFRQDWANAD